MRVNTRIAPTHTYVFSTQYKALNSVDCKEYRDFNSSNTAQCSVMPGDANSVYVMDARSCVSTTEFKLAQPSGKCAFETFVYARTHICLRM